MNSKNIHKLFDQVRKGNRRMRPYNACVIYPSKIWALPKWTITAPCVLVCRK